MNSKAAFLLVAQKNAEVRDTENVSVAKKMSKYSLDAFLIVAQESNPFLEPQKPTDGGKKKKKKVKYAH